MLGNTFYHYFRAAGYPVEELDLNLPKEQEKEQIQEEEVRFNDLKKFQFSCRMMEKMRKTRTKKVKISLAKWHMWIKIPLRNRRSKNL